MKNYFPDMGGYELDTLKRSLWDKIRIVYFDGADELIDDDDVEKEKIISESKEDIVRICLIILVSYEYHKNQF